jgi:glycosyltransferase involved in cell wall biosynthesis
VCFPFVGRDLGGSHFSSLGLIKGIDRSRYEPIVMLQHMEGPIFDFFRESGVDVLPAPTTRALARGKRRPLASLMALAASAPRLAERIKADRIGIVHCNDGRTSATWALAAKLAGAKVVWHNRGDPNALGLRFVAPFLADRIVSVSAFASPKPGLISPTRKNSVVFSPFDVDVKVDRVGARAALVEELRVDPSTLFIGYFGALVERKRPLLFVETIAEIIKAQPERRVMGLFFGTPRSNEDEAAMARAKALGVGEAVRLMGFRSPGSRWIGACDILLVPAVGEPLGRTLVEAMLVGTPVVATDSGGNPEAIRHGETGWIGPPEDAKGLAKAVGACLASPRRLEILARAAADARTRFGAKPHIDAIMEIYDQLTGVRMSGLRPGDAIEALENR